MARVTVEDCVLKIPNRFELVMMAAQRARDVATGATLSIDRDNDKNPVVALREIADETIGLDELRNALIKGHQKVVEPDEPEDDIVELMAGEQAWAQQMTIGEDDLAGEGDELGADSMPMLKAMATTRKMCWPGWKPSRASISTVRKAPLSIVTSMTAARYTNKVSAAGWRGRAIRVSDIPALTLSFAVGERR